MIPVADAVRRILARAEPLPPETVALGDALGRVLAEDLASRRTQPPAAVSAMDGYAVRAGDVAAPPVTLAVVGEVPAGASFGCAVGAGEREEGKGREGEGGRREEGMDEWVGVQE